MCLIVYVRRVEEEGLSSNRPELVALSECLEKKHDDHIDLLYFTDSETSLQGTHKWIGDGAKLNLSKSPDADVLKVIVLEASLQDIHKWIGGGEKLNLSKSPDVDVLKDIVLKLQRRGNDLE